MTETAERAAPRAIAVEHGGGALAFDRVRLDYRDRFLRRRRLTTAGGIAVVVDLAETVSLDDGDALVLEDGRRVLVEATAEPLLEARAAAGAPDGTLVRLAWHVGNRHTPAEIRADRLLVQRDHVIEDLLRRLGAEVAAVEAPFRPEGGAYGYGRTHGHHHGGAAGNSYGRDHDPGHHHDHHGHDRG